MRTKRRRVGFVRGAASPASMNFGLKRRLKKKWANRMSHSLPFAACFQPGVIALSPRLQAMGAECLAQVHQHLSGDWGAVDASTRQANDRALREAGRLFACYETEYGEIWITTDETRTLTLCFLPEEYAQFYGYQSPLLRLRHSH